MENKRFRKNDEGFVCARCGKEVPPLGYTSRNHCPFCLYSLHVDVFPGDRAENCGGLMEPVAAAPHPKKGIEIAHRCLVCGAVRKNRAASDDNEKLILSLISRPMP